MRWTSTAVLALVFSLVAAAADSDGWLSQLRFSPDGRYVLAQDRAVIALLMVHPFGILFRLPAEHATRGQFTPDSKEIVLMTSITSVGSNIALSPGVAHVERWRIADHIRVGFTELPSHNCETIELSPDGRVVVCVGFDGDLRLVDVASSKVLFEKRHFGKEYDQFYTYSFPGRAARPPRRGEYSNIAGRPFCCLQFEPVWRYGDF
jgi:WD40 repeat protein